MVGSEQQDLAFERYEPIEQGPSRERVVPRLFREQVVGVAPPHDESRHVLVHARAWIRSKELDERTVVAARPRRVRIKGRKLLQYFGFLLRRQVTASDLVDVLWTAGIHDQSALGADDILDREMDFIRAAGHLADRAQRRVHHDDVDLAKAEG